MDLYCYFHPHHNPRLRNVPLRQQEIEELREAALELEHAAERAKLRTSVTPVGRIKEEHFGEIITALSYVVESLTTLAEAHPGDSEATTLQIVEERKGVPGWESWTKIVQEQLQNISRSIAKNSKLAANVIDSNNKE